MTTEEKEHQEHKDRIENLITNGIWQGFNLGIEACAQSLEIIFNISSQEKTPTEEESKYFNNIITFLRSKKKDLKDVSENTST